VSLSMPFDVSGHPEGDSPVAQEMQRRLTQDLTNYQHQINSAKKVQTGAHLPVKKGSIRLQSNPEVGQPASRVGGRGDHFCSSVARGTQ
jgi:hypothetical protein